MRLKFIVEVDVMDEELASLNTKRKRHGLQQHTAVGLVENQVVDALNYDKLLSNATCKPVPLNKRALRAAGDADATL